MTDEQVDRIRLKLKELDKQFLTDKFLLITSHLNYENQSEVVKTFCKELELLKKQEKLIEEN